MWEGLRTAGLDNDKTMKRPIETVKESRCISSCTPSPVPPLPWNSELMTRGLKTHSKRTGPPCVGSSASPLLGKTEKNWYQLQAKTPVPRSDLIQQKERCWSPARTEGAWLAWAGDGVNLLAAQISARSRALDRGQYPVFLAMSPIPSNPEAKVKRGNY